MNLGYKDCNDIWTSVDEVYMVAYIKIELTYISNKTNYVSDEDF